MGPCPALARPNVAQILGADTHEQSSCCLTVPLPFRLVCGRLPDMVCSNDHNKTGRGPHLQGSILPRLLSEHWSVKVAGSIDATPPMGAASCGSAPEVG